MANRGGIEAAPVTMDCQDLGDRIGHLSAWRMREIVDGLRLVFEQREPPDKTE